jgi:tetratricopeptide (TPR) repeat protein
MELRVATKCAVSLISGSNRFGRRLLVFAILAALYLPASLVAQSTVSPILPDNRIPQLEMDAESAAARGDDASAVMKYKAILDIDTHISSAYYNLGLLYVKLRQFPEAVAILKQGLQIDPQMHSPAALLGISFFEMGEYAEARPQLEAALRDAPQDVNLGLYWAKDLMALNEYELAERSLSDLAQRAPGNQEVWYLLGTAYLNLSREAFAKLDAIDSNSFLAHEIKGDVMSSMGNYDGALAEYKKVLQMAANEPGVHYKLGNVYWRLIDWPNATREFQAELANNPWNCSAQWKLGNILLEQHVNSEAALADIDKALKICPHLIQARSDRGRALIRLNRYSEALTELETVAAATPDDPTVHFLLSQAYRGLGKTKEAQAETETFGRLDQAARAATAAAAADRVRPEDKTTNQ